MRDSDSVQDLHYTFFCKMKKRSNLESFWAVSIQCLLVYEDSSRMQRVGVAVRTSFYMGGSGLSFIHGFTAEGESESITISVWALLRPHCLIRNSKESFSRPLPLSLRRKVRFLFFFPTKLTILYATGTGFVAATCTGYSPSHLGRRSVTG